MGINSTKITSIFNYHDWLFYRFYVWISWRLCSSMKYLRMLLNYLLLMTKSFRYDGKRKLLNVTELFYDLDLIWALPNSCYVYNLKRNNSEIQNDLILQNNFPIFKTKLSFPQKTFHEVPKTKYGDVNQEPPFLKASSNVHWRVSLILKCRFSVAASYNWCFYILLTHFFLFHLLKTWENFMVFRCFQGVQKRNISSIWVNPRMTNVPSNFKVLKNYFLS